MHKTSKTIKIGTKIICPTCHKIFTKEKEAQKYCNKKCTKTYTEENYKNKILPYFFIRNIRYHYYNLKQTNPKKAKEIKEQMQKEEGNKFTKIVLKNI